MSKEAVMTVEVIVLPGEGIGPEVIAEAVKVLEWFQKHRDVHFFIRCEPYGVDAYEKYGTLIKEDVFPIFSVRMQCCLVLPAGLHLMPFRVKPKYLVICSLSGSIWPFTLIYVPCRPMTLYQT